jgi:choline dehydrogenase-like flavoprotein
LQQAVEPRVRHHIGRLVRNHPDWVGVGRSTTAATLRRVLSGSPGWRSGVTLNRAYLRPKSRGTVRLASADPSAAPLIDPSD